MEDPETIARSYLQAWNETDPQHRDRLLAEHWSADARYVDPLMRGRGRQEIAQLIAGVQARFPGFRFALDGQPTGYGGHVRFSWTLGPDGAEPPIKGSDVVALQEGQIAQVIGFLDQVPETA